MDEVKSRVVDLDLNDVLPNRFQPRIKFSEDSIIELSESIKEHGVIQPIVVRPIGDKYEIIAGERRYKASVLAGKETIPAIITDLNDKDSAEVALIENVQRKDLTAIEEAISYKKILDMGYLTQEQLAVKLGRSQSTVANKIRLLNLCDEVQEALMEDKISERHARSMLKLQTAEQQRILLDKIIKDRLTVRKTDEEIEKMNTYINNSIDAPETPASNPGFVDVDRIANNAQDLKFEDPSGNVNINALLQGNSAANINPAESTIPVIPAVEQQNNIFNPTPVVPTAPVDLMAPAVNPVQPQMPVGETMVNQQNVSVFPQVPLANSGIEPISTVPTVEPVVPVMESIPAVPTVEPVAPVMEPIPAVAAVEPVAPVVEPAPAVPTVDVFNSVPTITPIVTQQEPLTSMSAMPTTPIVEEPLPGKFLETEEVPVVPAVEPVVPEPVEPAVDSMLEEKDDEIRPIIITDYSKQYDPVIPSAAPAPEKVDFKQIINLIRDVNNTIEKCGYTIETEEYDLEGVYQVVFKINKD